MSVSHEPLRASGLVWLFSLDGIVRAVWLRLRASQPSCVAGGHRQGLLEAQAEIERITHGDELLLVSNDHDVYVDGVKGAMLEFFPSDPKISLRSCALSRAFLWVFRCKDLSTRSTT